MQNNIQILKAVPEDAKATIEVLNATWLATYPNEKYGITVEDIKDANSEAFSGERVMALEKKIQNTPPNELRLVAKDSNAVVGVARMIRNENNNQLQMIYVLPEYQGKGIGGALSKKMFEFIDSSKETIVQVAVYNAQAIAFYEKLGFKDTGKRFAEERFKMKSGNTIPEMEMAIKPETK